ncbi:MAG: TIGR04002 family protein [Clostridium sp.]|nr:TIGR04002 family protein [Clostridium sp.]MCM1546825.1 TIGR04002 family protein [Ruminococcus sp.]
MKNKKIMNMVMTGLFAAMICVTTAYIMHIPAPNGYIHLGDVFIYAAACILPMPYGIAAAGIGGAMADLVSGYPVYVIPTLIIKSLNALCFYAFGRREKLLCWKTITASAVSCAVTIIGYYIAAVILYGNPAAQIVNTIPSNAVQGIASGVIFCAAAYSMDKTKIKFLS